MICILAFGIVFPFIDYLVVVETFYLLMPLAILLFASLALLVGYLIWDRGRLKKSILFISAVPLFIGTQFFSTWTVDNVQRLRCEYVIKEIENIISRTGEVPDDYRVRYGIKFSRVDTNNEFRLSYSRGFMVTEIYHSNDKVWKSQGWND
jgi:hypothetical protein